MEDLRNMIISKIGKESYDKISGIINEVRQDGYDNGYEDGRSEAESVIDGLNDDIEYYMEESSRWQTLAFED